MTPDSTTDHNPGPGPASTHLVLIPSYNTGPKLGETVTAALQYWRPVWVVIDGSTDGSGAALRAQMSERPGLRILELPENQGKGVALLHGLREAAARGFTHALTMDADGQHPASSIPALMEASRRQPDALILGQPVFDETAPAIRLAGRKISNGLARLETLGADIGDCLFGARVYPIRPLLAVMAETRWMRRFDFDPEAVVRLCWRGLRPVNVPVPVRYFRPEEGGVSHFHYLRDNILLAGMHARLIAGCLPRLPRLLARAVGRMSGA